ncbi:unnamed protein product [Cylindrotheca closterium]|uniref:Uncharacterized protein n=1 Tax=Cylindrotheca closterium TaxID=2856 RepID=A0AAD2JGU4_9STRA|nr:unnamed protein product [Cylindrotheca closterium]
MVKILLSCNTDTYEFASDIREDIQEQLGFKVALDVEDESQNDPVDDGFQEELEEAAVVLVFQIGDESISAWIMIEEADDKFSEECKYEETMFPEIIDFSKSFQRGIKILRHILVNDFGLVVRPIQDNTQAPTVVQHKQVGQLSTLPIMDQLTKGEQELETAKAAWSMASENKPGLIKKFTKLFGKSRRRLSQ